VAILVDQYLASLADIGGVAAYNYGGKITSVLIGAGALPLGVAVLPHFSLQIRAGNRKEFRQTLIVWSGIVGSLATLAAILVWFFSRELVQLMFHRGAFSSKDVELVANIQKFLALQLPFYLCSILYVRALASLQRNGLVALVALTNAAVNIGGGILLLSSFGVVGIALAASGGYVLASSVAFLLIFVIIEKGE
jgi:putative peptidoglycan lipid II flippase